MLVFGSLTSKTNPGNMNQPDQDIIEPDSEDPVSPGCADVPDIVEVVCGLLDNDPRSSSRESGSSNSDREGINPLLGDAPVCTKRCKREAVDSVKNSSSHKEKWSRDKAERWRNINSLDVSPRVIGILRKSASEQNINTVLYS